MKKNEKASISLKKILAISIIFIFLLGISVLAGNSRLNSVKITFSDSHEITVVTSKTKVSDILSENHIILASNETVSPAMDENITDSKTVKIAASGTEIVTPTQQSDKNDISDIQQKYKNITEKIISVKEEIPFETITKDVSGGSKDAVNKILQYGKNGLKETKYDVTYQNDVEINRVMLESNIIEEPVNQIVQVQKKPVVTSRSGLRIPSDSLQTGSGTSAGTYKITAYTSSYAECGKSDGITASGQKATGNHTVAAPGIFPFGTKLLIGGQVYTVEDRGGSIQGNRIDIYMDSYSDARAWGVRYMDVQVIE